MKKLRESALVKRIAVFTAISMLWEIAFPTVAWALTGGPSQPEVQSFEPVGTTEMVDLTSGDFVYNIPLLDVGGYPINLSYHAGINMEQEASWVGLGWNINPGVINRNMRGLPDDFKGDKVDRTLSTKRNWSVGVDYTRTKHSEIYGKQCDDGKYSQDQLKGEMQALKDRGQAHQIFEIDPSSTSFTLGLNYNNYKGVGYSFNFGNSNKKGSLNLGYSSSNGFNVGGNISLKENLKKSSISEKLGGVNPGFNFNSRSGLVGASFGIKGKLGGMADNILTFGEVRSTPSPQPNFYSYGGTIAFAGGKTDILGAFKVKNKFLVDFNTSAITNDDQNNSYNSYGYLYQNDANNESLPSRLKCDFSRVFDEQISKSTVFMPLAQKTYDGFGASGQGTGSGIRLQEAYVSPVVDPETKVLSGTTRDIAVEFGKGNGFKHLGADIAFSFQVGRSNLWTDNNKIISKFPQHVDPNSHPLYEPVYFQTMGENVPIDKSRYENFQADRPINCELKKFPFIKVESEDLENATNQLTQRAKRNQITSYLTAENAALAAINRQIENYPPIEANDPNMFEDRIVYTTSINPNVQANQKNYYKRSLVNRNDGIDGHKKPHHLSELTTLNPDGTRYVYGLPAYIYSTVERTFAVEAASGDVTNYSNYTANNLSVDNNWGLDNFYLREHTPAYAHSFLLTSILSSDYVDITQDGITDDDYGNYVKINYSKLIPKTTGEYPVLLPNSNVRWRAPYSNARLQKGLESDDSDDKASFVEGTKEVWYMHSVETKDYVAEFYTSYRDDGLDAKIRDGENDNSDNIKGGKGNYAARKLDKIVLYNRYDRKQNGVNATPIKTVHFEYDYSLCQGVPNQINSGQGKLTLKKVWFSYGKIINTSPIAPYEFTYPAANTISNPDYNEMYQDYWGNYQDYSSPNTHGGNYSLHPDEFPYVDQDNSRTNLDAYSAAWNLTEIKLPSGGKIKVTYEADDYAYVQDKHAMEFFKIIGFSKEVGTAITEKLYDGTENNNFIHFELHGLCTKEELKAKYIKNNSSFMVYVKMIINPLLPNKQEWVKAYVEMHGGIDDYGIVDGHGYIKVKSISIFKNKIRQSGGSGPGINPIARMGWEFVKENMPWEVFPMSDLKRTGNNGVPGNLTPSRIAKIGIKMYSVLPSVILGENFKLKKGSFCSQVNLIHSYIRLNDPDGVKIGGGCRVKKIEFSDAWNTITASNEEEHVYGQIYDYSTTNESNEVISSGVLDYEPLSGGLECPFKIPFVNRHDRKISISQDYHYTDAPVYEGYIPTGTIVYSKVKVRNIKPKDLDNNNPDIKRHGTGYVINEFYTAKDYPIGFNHTPFEHKIKKNWALKLFGVNKTVFGGYQGYSLVLNDMHGKPKGNKVYNEYGKLMSSVEYVYQTDPNNPSHLVNEVNVIKPNGDIVNNELIGVDYEITIDPREIKQDHINLGVELNFESTAPVIQVVPPFWPRFKWNHQGTRTMSITKIINKRGIIKKVIAYDLEARVETENLLYDSETGEVLLTSVDNEYGDKQYNFKQPAHWVYEGMSGAYKNIGAVRDVSLSGGEASVLKGIFYPGDELINLNDRSNPEKAWVISAVTDPANTLNDKIRFVTHKNGTESCTPANGDRKFLIIRSGRRNISSAPIGEIASMNNPIPTSGNQLVFSKVLASSAVEYTDNWQAFQNLDFDAVHCPSSNGSSNYNCSYFKNCPPGGGPGIGMPDDFTCNPNFQDPNNYLQNITKLKITRKKYNGSTVFFDPISQRCFYVMDCILFELLPCIPLGPNEPIPRNKSNIDNKDPEEIEQDDDEREENGMDNALNTNVLFDLAFGGETKKNIGPSVFDEFANPISPEINGNGASCGMTINPFYKYKKCELIESSAILGNQYRFEFEIFANPSCSTSNCKLVFINNRGIDGDLNRSGNFLYNLSMDNLEPPNIACFDVVDETDFSNYWLKIQDGFSLECSSGYSEYWADLKGHFAGSSQAQLGNGTTKTIDFDYEDIPNAFKIFKKCKECPINPENKKINTVVELSSQNPYLNASRGNWRPKLSYSYYDKSNTNHRRELEPTASTDPNNTQMRNSGAIKNYVTFWNPPTGPDPHWTKSTSVGTSTSPWIATNEVTLVNPNSQELENKNALDIYSAALYSQFQNQALAVAQNAKYRNIQFESFEDFEHGMSFDAACVEGSGNSTVDGNFSPQIMSTIPVHWPIWTIFNSGRVTPTRAESHTGLISLKVFPGSFGMCLGDNLSSLEGCNETAVPLIPTFSPEKGTYILDFWAKHDGEDIQGIVRFFSVCGNFESKQIGSVITVDGWRKYTYEIKVKENVSGIKVAFVNPTNTPLYVDDIRFQPMASEMKGFVYEKLTQRLTAELDANNYATFYEYDEQGNLIRVKKETEKGIVTIKENRQNIKR